MSVVEAGAASVSGAAASATCRLAVAWQHPRSRKISPVGLLELDGTSDYTFRYVQNALDVPGFRPLVGFPSLTQAYRSSVLFPIFAQRVMDPRRPDYSRYVRQLGLDEDLATPWEQMARSGGRREGDLLQLFPEPQVQDDGQIVTRFLVHGIRHVAHRPEAQVEVARRVTAAELEAALARLIPGQPLDLVRESENPENDQALLVVAEGEPLGWVPDFLLEELRQLVGQDLERIHLKVEIINPPDTLAHMRLLVGARVCPSTGYLPLSGPQWEALA